VEELQKDAVKNCTRGPYLAAVEIERRRSLNEDCNNSKVVEALVNYFERFVVKPQIFSSLQAWLPI
jgi:N-terminal acetyltransferase B complex non-catalytic subunit